MCIDADPGPWDLCVLAEMRQIHTDYQVLLRKRDSVATFSRGEHLAAPWPLSQKESASTVALTGFYCFSEHITLRMVLIYYLQVHCRWLPFSENKGEDVANYIKKEGYLQMKREKWLNWLHPSLEGLA